MWLVGEEKNHLGKYFSCLLRFGAHHKRNICAAQSWVKEETQMVPGTKLWKLIHGQNKGHLFNNLFAVYVFVWPYRPAHVQMSFLPHRGGLYVCFCCCRLIWRTEKSWEDRILWIPLFVYPCKVQIFQCLLVSTFMSLGSCGAILTQANTLEKGSWAVFVGHSATPPTKSNDRNNFFKKQKKNKTKNPTHELNPVESYELKV